MNFYLGTEKGRFRKDVILADKVSALSKEERMKYATGYKLQVAALCSERHLELVARSS